MSVCVNLGSINLVAAAVQQEVTENLGRAGVKVTVEKAMKQEYKTEAWKTETVQTGPSSWL